VAKLKQNQLPIEWYQHFGRGWSVPIKFGPKGTDPQQKGCAFNVSHAACCAVSDSWPSCYWWHRHLVKFQFCCEKLTVVHRVCALLVHIV